MTLAEYKAGQLDLLVMLTEKKMAGSYRHVVDHNNEFIGNEDFVDSIENLGDAYEAIEEMYHIIQGLSGGDKQKIYEAHNKWLQKKYPDRDYSYLTFDYFWEDYSE